jgi:hypothetical protein
MEKDVARADDRRSAIRSSINVPLVIALRDGEILAFTKDVSNQGAFFFVSESDGRRLDGEFPFFLDLPPEVTRLPYCRVECVGMVVRKESLPGMLTGVGVKIIRQTFVR